MVSNGERALHCWPFTFMLRFCLDHTLLWKLLTCLNERVFCFDVVTWSVLLHLVLIYFIVYFRISNHQLTVSNNSRMPWCLWWWCYSYLQCVDSPTSNLMLTLCPYFKPTLDISGFYGFENLIMDRNCFVCVCVWVCVISVGLTVFRIYFLLSRSYIQILRTNLFDDSWL